MSKELDIQQDLKHQQKAWFVRSIGAGVIVLLVIATALGLFGSGVLSNTTEGNIDEGFYIETEKFLRAGAEAEIFIFIKGGFIEGDTLKLLLSSSFIERTRIEKIIPEPVQQFVSGNFILFNFAAANADVYKIRIDYIPQKSGSLFINMKLAGKSEIKFNQLIYP